MTKKTIKGQYLFCYFYIFLYVTVHIYLLTDRVCSKCHMNEKTEAPLSMHKFYRLLGRAISILSTSRTSILGFNSTNAMQCNAMQWRGLHALSVFQWCP